MVIGNGRERFFVQYHDALEQGWNAGSHGKVTDMVQGCSQQCGRNRVFLF